MNARLPSIAMQSQSPVETTVFQSGNSQAIRIPKEFQFHTKKVEIFREGNAIILRPVPTTAAEALNGLPPLSATEARALDQAMQQVDDLLALDEPSPEVAAPRKRARATKG
jgi:virulence-associated protein VagC